MSVSFIMLNHAKKRGSLAKNFLGNQEDLERSLLENPVISSIRFILLVSLPNT